MTIRILFTVLCMAVSSASSAAVFKSVDANGKVVYSDRPSDNTVKISMINAAVMTPVYEKKVSVAPGVTMRKVALLQDSWSAASTSANADLASRGLNARGEECARIAAENAKKAVTAGGTASFAGSK